MASEARDRTSARSRSARFSLATGRGLSAWTDHGFLGQTVAIGRFGPGLRTPWPYRGTCTAFQEPLPTCSITASKWRVLNILSARCLAVAVIAGQAVERSRPLASHMVESHSTKTVTIA